MDCISNNMSLYSIFYNVVLLLQVSRGILSGVLQEFSSSLARVWIRVYVSYRNCAACCCSLGVCMDTWAPHRSAA